MYAIIDADGHCGSFTTVWYTSTSRSEIRDVAKGRNLRIVEMEDGLYRPGSRIATGIVNEMIKGGVWRQIDWDVI